MVMPEAFGKFSHRAITIDAINENKYMNDDEIVEKINSWLDDFKKRIGNIHI